MRYKATEIDGQWFVWDLKHPDKPPVECYSKREAEISARAWNLIAKFAGEL